MKKFHVLSMGLIIISLVFGGSHVIGQDAAPSDEDAQNGVWLGMVTSGADSAVDGEIAFMVDGTGVAYIGGIRFTSLGDDGMLADDEQCIIVFDELSMETPTVSGDFTTPTTAEGTFEVASCFMPDQGYAIFDPAIMGTWQASPAETDEIPDALVVFARHPTEIVESGEALFDLRCGVCHGPGGTGTEIAPPFVDFPVLPYEYIEVRVRSGPEVMSAFTEQDITEAQLNDLVTYIQTELVGTAIREYSEEELALGRELYIEKCAECHGTRGQGTNDFGPPLLIWPPYSVTGIIQGARVPLPEMQIVRVSNDELDLIAGYYILEMSSGD